VKSREYESSASTTIIAASYPLSGMFYGGCVRADFGLAGFLLPAISLRT